MGDRTVDMCRRVLGRVGIATVDDDACALCGEVCGDLEPDTARAADDDGAAPG